MAPIEDQIRAVEEETHKTPYNKATQHHIGKLKAKLARLKEEALKRAAKGKGGGPGYAVRKSGNATIGLVGFPSTGKSTLLNAITAASSEVAAYDFTTLEVIPGLLEYKGAKIQVLDMPGIIRGASKGRGRGREVISVARVCDLVLLMVDVFETNVPVLADELYSAGIRLNSKPADVVIKKRLRGDTLAEPKLVQGDRLMRFDMVLANPPYSIKQWDREAFSSDPWGRNLYGTPPQGRADYAFWQHILLSMTPKAGRCAILFPHGVLFRREGADLAPQLV